MGCVAGLQSEAQGKGSTNGHADTWAATSLEGLTRDRETVTNFRSPRRERGTYGYTVSRWRPAGLCPNTVCNAMLKLGTTGCGTKLDRSIHYSIQRLPPTRRLGPYLVCNLRPRRPTPHPDTLTWSKIELLRHYLLTST